MPATRTVNVGGVDVAVKLRRNGVDVGDTRKTRTGMETAFMAAARMAAEEKARPTTRPPTHKRTAYIAIGGLSPNSPQTWPAKVYEANPEIWAESPEDARELAKIEYPMKTKFLTLRRVEDAQGRVVVQHGHTNVGLPAVQRYQVDAMMWEDVFVWDETSAEEGQRVFERLKEGKRVKNLKKTTRPVVMLGQAEREAKRAERARLKVRTDSWVADVDTAEVEAVFDQKPTDQKSTTAPPLAAPPAMQSRIDGIVQALNTPAVRLMTGHAPTADEIMTIILERGLTALEQALGRV